MLNKIELICFIRAMEEIIAKNYSKGIFRCPVHLAIGQEAVAVAIISQLAKEDLVFASHRAHHHYLAKGGDPFKMLAEIAGLSVGCSKGNGGSTHLIDEEFGFMGSTAIISGVVPVAAGAALALKQQGKKNIVVVCIGDAAIEEGVFFETLNIAKLWKLPILFLIEDNEISCYTDKLTRQSYSSYKNLANLFNVPFLEIDGSNLLTSESQSKEFIDSMKLDFLPRILHAKVFRAMEHCGPEDDNHLAYRTNEGKWPALDPIEKLKESFSREVEQSQVKAKLEAEKILYQVLKLRETYEL